MKKTEKHRAVDKNMFFQDSVISFHLNSQAVSGWHILSSYRFDLFKLHSFFRFENGDTCYIFSVNITA